VFGVERLVQHRVGQCLSEQSPITGNEPAWLGEPPMGRDEIGPRQTIAIEEHAIIATARSEGAIANFRGAKPALLMPDARQRHPEFWLPLLDQSRGRGSRAVIGDHHLESTVALARQRSQHGIERIRPVECRHDEGDQVGHGLGFFRAMRACYAVPRRTSAMANRAGAG